MLCAPHAQEDRVVCSVCNINLVNREPSDVPWSEHECHQPTCPLVRNEPTSDDPFRSTLFAHCTRTHLLVLSALFVFLASLAATVTFLERVREWESERVREWESERVREWESERVREWESERVREWESERWERLLVSAFPPDSWNVHDNCSGTLIMNMAKYELQNMAFGIQIVIICYHDVGQHLLHLFNIPSFSLVPVSPLNNIYFISYVQTRYTLLREQTCRPSTCNIQYIREQSRNSLY